LASDLAIDLTPRWLRTILRINELRARPRSYHPTQYRGARSRTRFRFSSEASPLLQWNSPSRACALVCGSTQVSAGCEKSRVDPIRRLRESIPCRTKAPQPLAGRGCPHFEYQGTQRAALGGRWRLRQFSHPSKAVVRRSDQRRADRGRARLGRLQDQIAASRRMLL
jgi:hypothetical protein